MQQMNPKDRPKLIAIGVALVAVVGFGVKTTMDTIASVSGGAPAAVPPPAVGGATVTPAPTPAPPAPEENAYVLRSSYGDRSRDPFTPVSDKEFILRSVKSASFAQGAPPPAPVAAGGITSRPTFQRFRDGLAQANRDIPNFPAVGDEINKVGSVPAAPAVPAPVIKILPPPPPPYAVVGVLIGEAGGRDVAILSRNGGGDKKFVVAGDALEGGYTVTAIESGGVRVTHPGRRSATGAASAEAVPVNGSTEYYLPKQTATSLTLPLGETSKPAASTNAPGIR